MSAAPKWVPAAPALVEDPSSGEVAYDDSGTLTKIYTGKYADCLAGALPKGTEGSGATAGLFVKSCRVSKSKGEIGKLVIVWGGYTSAGGGGGVEDPQVPADTFGLDPMELNPPIERNPLFKDLFPPASGVGTYERMLQDEVVQAVQGATESDRTHAIEVIDAAADSDARDQAYKVVNLLRKGTTNYYLAGFIYHWTTYSLTEPTVNNGGYRETPGGPLASLIGGMDLICLRQADALTFNDGFYALTQIWACAPKIDTASHWDEDLYTAP